MGETAPRKQFRCRLCRKDDGTRYETRRDLNTHQTTVHMMEMIGGEHNLQPTPFSDDNAPWNHIAYSPEYREKMKANYNNNRALILRPNQYSDTESQLNVPMPGDVNIDRLMSAVRLEFFRVDSPFKINFSPALLLYHTEERQFRLFLAYENSSLFSLPALISQESDLDELENRLRSLDLSSMLLRQRPSTKYIPVMVTNVIVNLWFLTDLAIGCDYRKQPDFIRNNRGIKLFTPYSRQASQDIAEDNLCFFKCISFHLHKTYSSQVALTLYRQWVDFCKERNIKDACLLNENRVTGITLCNIVHAEELFNLNIEVYMLDSYLTCRPIMRSLRLHDDTMCVNLDDSYCHFLYISDFNTYAKKFVCSGCEQVYRQGFRLRRHYKTCDRVTQDCYPGGFYEANDDLFAKLNYCSIPVDKNRTFCRDFVFFDIESLLLDRRENVSESTCLNQQHKAISIGVASTIPGYTEGQVFINEDERELCTEFVSYLKEVQLKYEQMMFTEYQDITDKILRLYYLWKLPNKDAVECDDIIPQNDDQDGGDHCADQAGETSYYEPPSAEFLQAIQRPNTWHNFCSNLQQDVWGAEQQVEQPSDPPTDETAAISPNDEANTTQDEYKSLFEKAKEEYKVEPEFTNEELTFVDYCSKQQRKAMFNKISNLYDEFSQWCCQLVVTGFNTSSYDLNVLKKNLFSMIDIDKCSIIKKGNKYRLISGPRWRWIDCINYTPAGTSFRQFLKCWAPDLPDQKLFFPYPALGDLQNLSMDHLPEYDHQWWISDLDGCHLLEEDGTRETGLQNHAKMVEMWDDNNIQDLKQWLCLYNLYDCAPGVSAFQCMREMYESKGVDILKSVISTPGVSRALLFSHSQANNDHFSLFNETDKEIKKRLENSIVAGPALIFRRLAERGVTYMDPDIEIERNSGGGTHVQSDATHAQEYAKVKHIQGFDSTSLYTWCLSQELPTGNYIKRDANNNFIPEVAERFELQYAYFNYLNDVQGCDIKHRQNLGRETYLGCYKVDGIDYSKVGGVTIPRAYEVQGCYFHRDTCYLTKHIKDKDWLKSVNEEREKILKREEHLKIMGYEPIFIKECTLRDLYKQDPRFKHYVDSQRPAFYQKYKNSCTQQDIIDGIKSGLFYGIVECSVRLPEDDQWPADCKYKPDDTSQGMRAHFENYPALFGHCQVTPDLFGDFMTDFAKREGIDISKPRELLISTNKSEGLMLGSPYLKLLLELGFEVHDITFLLEYKPRKCFKSLMDEYVDIRRESDKDSSKAILGNTAKLLCNSSYGSLLLCQSKFRSVSFAKSKKEASSKINNRRFVKMATVNRDDEIFEIEALKTTIRHTMPIQIAFMVLQWAKVRMLQFYYLFLDKFLEKGSFFPFLMDTDSIYICLKDDFEKCIKKDKLAEYNEQIYGHCTPDEIPIAENQFFSRGCCDRDKCHDKRVPGRFHQECYATYGLALSAKCYFVEDEETNKSKFSSKGVQKRVIDKSGADYKYVYNNQKHITKTNKGFTVRNNDVYTYETKRNALSLIYVKRECQKGGSVTKCLNVAVGPKYQQPEPVPESEPDALHD